MDWLDRFNAAVDYIENNLDGEIEYSLVAQAACCSEFHFSRMFSSLLGISLSEYIRRRRLTKAAFDIQTSDAKIIDIALKYGYDSADAFTRSFKKLHNVTPNAVRDTGVQLKAYPRISFQITIKGDVELEYRVERMNTELRFAGKRQSVKTSRAFKEIPALWRKSNKDGFKQALIDMSWVQPKCRLESLVGICGKEAAITDEVFDYFMGVRYDTEIPSNMEEIRIAPSTYAVFPNVIDAWKRLYSEWLPTSGYELANLPCIEHYLGPGHKIKHELWVPIIEK
ncbi:AraC family transcriptional regulator [Paenibacillus sp. MMS20-IR301]|uniref:AraC family transcriptional regulator n=1 Tax=Paenibacillus sp. MMS20-IR301 TaxID=2895946 RepID=UPI0028F12C08|nr:AraC family transcriptional regulator [Paenibacillus sp. MMS20-IR301]WNS40837.1 AraC family transcriptional regulator [Paenibacillus sp. MMS20-IR301]